MPTLNWIGKEAVVKHHKDVPFRLLEPVAELSCTTVRPEPVEGQNNAADAAHGSTSSPRTECASGNLIVQGDNLHALKALLPRYAGQVKCIYIDPPYNTGNEGWVYNDNVNSAEIKKWLGEVVGKEGETLDRHDRWLCMMYPRLLLLKQFLREDGVIFISIDDVANSLLKQLCDEIFGAKNFITTLIWNTEGNTDNQFEVKVNHEYILMYVREVKNKSDAIGRVVDPNTREDSNLWKGFADNNINKNNPANPPAIFTIPIGFPSKEKDLFYAGKKVDSDFFEITKREGFVSDEIKSTYGIEKLSGLPVKLDDLLIKDNKIVKPCRVYGGFANRKKLEQFVANQFKPVDSEDGPIEFYINANAAIRYRKIVDTPRNILSVLRGFGTTERMRGELRRMGVNFDYPKPVDLISYLLKIGATSKNSLILDSFAGSGTTGHAVLKQNREDEGNRSFILVEMNEDISTNVTAKRVRLVSKGYTDSKGTKITGLGGDFQFCTLSKEPLFTAEGQIREDVTYAQLAEFVWFVETGTGLQMNHSFPFKGKVGMGMGEVAEHLSTHPLPSPPLEGEGTMRSSDRAGTVPLSPLLGIHEGRAIYLLYNGILKDKSVGGGNVLTAPVLDILPPYDGVKVIYATACRLGATRLAREQIVFKQTPYALGV
ncbi:MAG: site-specific DNA-methyltransferase [Gallionella sp.]|nr:site-specific DNA-methyltransferase [Gallionella sp.]